MKHMKRLQMLVVAWLCCTTLTTAKVQIDEVWYQLYSNPNHAVVERPDDGTYTGNIDIPSVVKYGEIEYPVTAIGGSAFYDCQGLTSVILPEGVTEIGAHAFNNCRQLIEVNIPTTVESIGYQAFFHCYELASPIVIPEGVTVIESETFSGCNNLPQITMRGDIVTIGDGAFGGCSSLTSLSLPESVTSIGGSAFYRCSNLASVNIPKGVTEIKLGTFWQCSKLAAIEIPAGVTSIASLAFEDCNSLTEVVIPNNVTTIADRLFNNCSNLTSVILPEGVTSIGSMAFKGCNKLETVNFPKSLTLIDKYAFSECASLTTAIIPEGVTTIGREAFFGCSSLTAITVPASVTSIEQHAFNGCTGALVVECNIPNNAFVDSYFHKVTLGADVTSIGEYAFSDCSQLDEVYCYAVNVPSTASDAFLRCNLDQATLYVPGVALESYRATAPWSSFGTILPLDGDQPAEEGWSEWNHLGTAVTASGKESMIDAFQYWGTESVVAWDEPITIDQRTNVADPTKHQLRLNDIFNGKDIILDYDSSTSEITAERQATGYATNKELLVEQSGWSDFYDEFMFALDYTTGSYNPLTGTIDLSKAFFHVSDPSVQMFYFNLGFTLQIEGITPPTFTYAWDRAYVAREEREATLTVTFDGPIVRYRKLVIAPGQTVYTYQVQELYKANPETDLNYEETDQPTTTITCDQIGTYRVVLIPLGADGTAVMDYMLARMVSYAEPDYDSYTWNYIGESTVIEAMGSNLIPNEEAWEEVDGIWVNKYPWTVEVEGVQTYRRADNPNIIGLRNLYGENHPYSSMFQFIDQSQDWWVYIDVTNPEDVRLLTTPVGATSSYDGYASFISHYAEANAAATYTDGVITFPFFSVLLGNIVNQEQVAEFDFKVILPEEETMPMEAITVNQYGSGTYCSPYALDFSAVEGLKAYAATGYNKKTKVVTLTRVMTTQPGEGLFIKGEPGTYKVPVIEEADDNSLNMLVGALTETSVNAYSADGLYANYKYTIKEGDSQPLFYQFADGSTMDAGKAYLQIPVAWLPQTSETKSISLRFDEGEGTTDIEDSEFTIQNSEIIYDLFGRRVDNPVKGGIYIVGGRKVVY